MQEQILMQTWMGFGREINEVGAYWVFSSVISTCLTFTGQM